MKKSISYLLVIVAGHLLAIQGSIITTIRAAVGERKSFTAHATTTSTSPASTESTVREHTVFAVKPSGSTAIQRTRYSDGKTVVLSDLVDLSTKQSIGLITRQSQSPQLR